MGRLPACTEFDLPSAKKSPAITPPMIPHEVKVAQILEAIHRGVEKAAELHRRMGVPMVVWKDGKTVEIMPQKKRVSVRRTQ